MPPKRSSDQLTTSAVRSTESSSQSHPAKRKRLTGEQDVLQYIPLLSEHPYDHSPLMLVSDLYKTMVTIHVGPDSYPFHTYKELLCNNSSFFKAAFEKRPRKDVDQTISLPEYEVETFKIYQTFLTTTRLRYNFDHEEWWLCFAKLWVFAHRIGSPSLKKHTLQAMVNTMTRNPSLPCASPRAVAYTLDNACLSSPLGMALIKHFLVQAGTPDCIPPLEEYPQAFVSEMLQHMLNHARRCRMWQHNFDPETIWNEPDVECTGSCCTTIEK
ncbi:hypothetical protein G7Y79_00067g095470 [Physcia stellaris]|nr:hypothetical protein G7Y79_00067g095470 [Physcia stellaris]